MRIKSKIGKISAILIATSMVIPSGITYSADNSGLTEVADINGSIDYSGGDVEFTLNGSNLVEKDIKAYVILKKDEFKENQKRITDIEKSLKFKNETKNETSKKKLTLHFPKNEYNKSQEYIIRFSVDGKETQIYRDFQKTVKIRKNPNGVAKKEEDNILPEDNKITSFEAKENSKKGSYNFLIKGKKLDIKDVKVSILSELEINKMKTHIKDENLTKQVKLEKDGENIKFTCDFPTDTDKEYKVALTYKNERLLDKDITIRVKKGDSTGKNPNPVLEETALKSVTNKKEGLKYTFNLKGTNLDENKIKVKKVLLNRVNQQNLVDKIKFKKINDTELEATLVFDKVEEEKDYKVVFGTDQSNKKSVDCKITSTDKLENSDEVPSVTPPVLNKGEIENLNFENIVKQENNYQASFKILGNNLTMHNIKVKVMEENVRRADIEKTLTNLAINKIALPTLTFTKNDKGKTFKVYFNADGTDNFNEKNSVLVKVVDKSNLDPDPTVDPSEVNPSAREMKIESIKALTPNLAKSGGEAKISVKGENLDSKKLQAEIYKISDGKEIKQAKKIEFFGTKEVQTATINFEKVQKEEKYIIKLQDKKCQITVGGRESLETVAVVPEYCHINNAKDEIIVKLYAPIEKVVTDKEFKDGITLDGKKLGENTKVIVNDDKIIIKSTEKFDIKEGSKLLFEERLFKGVADNKENKSFHSLIKGAVAYGKQLDFIEGQVLNNKGGKVKLKFSGENLKEKVKVKVLKSDKQRTKVLSTEDKNVTVTKISDSEQEISFILPENKTEKPESYTVLVSVDGGLKYMSDYGANVLKSEKEKTTVATVLADKELNNKPTLSFMSITSYGTQGGGTTIPDITHTVTPVGQGSKKTWISLYGANLKESLTKIKVVDQNGVEWYPLENEGTTDSMDNFLLVMKNNHGGFGIFGEGTSQKIELICPRNIRVPNSDSPSPTYKILVAVDGIHYNEEITATVTVADDGDPIKESLSKDKIKEVSVSYETETGEQVIEPKKVKGYIWSKLRTFNVRAINKEGYKLKGLKVNDSDELKPLSYLNETEVYDSADKTMVEKVKFIYEKETPVINKELKEVKEKALTELEKLDSLTSEEKDSFKLEINKATEKSKISETLNQAKVKNTANKELKEAKEKAVKEVTELKNLTEAEKTRAVVEINKANNKAEVNIALDKTKELDKKYGAENPNVNPTPTPDVNPSPDVTPAPEIKSGWQNDEVGYKYQKENGSFAKDEWEPVNGTWYHFDENGYMQTGWLNLDGTWYYLNDDGSMAKDTWIGTYYVDESGSWLIEGWQNNGYGWWYQRANGTYPHNEWEIINGIWYYFDANGYMLADTTTPDGYYVDENGAWVG